MHDRMSASIINARLQALSGRDLLYKTGGGIVFNPEVYEIWCAFLGDGGTMHARPNHGCGSHWCDPAHWRGGTDQQCAWRPQHLQQMLETKEAQGHANYNEVLLATYGKGWDWPDRMPALIDAFVIAGADGAAVAAMHAEFHRQYPHARAALVDLDLGKRGAPFSDVFRKN